MGNRKSIKIILVFIVSFILLFSFFPNNTLAEEEKDKVYCPLCTHRNDDDPLYKKERQFYQKIRIIKAIFGNSIDEVALASAVLHRYSGPDVAYTREYEENFDENSFKKSWQDIFNVKNNVFKSSEDDGTNENGFGVTDLEKAQVEGNDKIALLTSAAIVMLDSNHLTTYSDVCFKDALAGDKLVNNDGQSGIFGDLINGFVCHAYGDKASILNPIEFIANVFNGDNILVSAESVNNRLVNTQNICDNGYVGGLYSNVRTIKDEDKKKKMKKVYAQQIIDLANYYKKLYGSGVEEENGCSLNVAGSTGAFASWRQFDDKWKNIPLGDTSSIGQAGCLVTSISMQMARSGTKIGSLPSGFKEFNPGAFVTSSNNNGGFAGGGNYAWQGYQTIAPNWGVGDFISLGTGSNKVLADAVSKELSTGYGSGNYQKFLVLQIHHATSSQHWVAVNGVTDGKVTIFDPAKNGTSLDENYNNWVVDGYRVMYAKDVPFGQTGTTSNNICSGSSDGTGQGNIVIPSQYSKPGYFTVTMIDGINWAPGTGQGALADEWKRKGSQYKDGIAVIDGRYLIACTTTFGKVGDKIDFYFDDGTKIPTIMMDEKSQQVVAWDPNPANKWGHDNGANILEFEVASSYYRKYGNPGNGYNNWYKEWSNKRVASATNLGKGSVSSSGSTSTSSNTESSAGYNIARVAVDAAVTASPQKRIQMSSPHERPTMKEAENYLKIHDAVWPQLIATGTFGTHSPYYASCGPAAIKVIHYSGADTTIPNHNPKYLIEHFESSPLWEEVKVDTSKTYKEVCQPGDVAVSNLENYHHVMIYVGNKLARKRFPNSNGGMWEAAEESRLLPGITTRDNDKVSKYKFKIYRLVSRENTNNSVGERCVNGRAVGGRGSSRLGYQMAELAVRVATGAAVGKGDYSDANRVLAQSHLHCGTQRGTIDSRMHDYIKLMDATTVKWMKKDWNGNSARNYFNNPNAAKASATFNYNNPAYCSCTQATGVIIRAVADPDFDMSGNPTKYLEGSPDKWTYVGRVEANENYDDICQPGDILNVQYPGAHHVMMYVGNELVRTRFPNSTANIYEGGYAKGSEYSWCPGLDKRKTPAKSYNKKYFDIWRPTGQGNYTYPFIDIEQVLAGPLETGPFWPGCY